MFSVAYKGTKKTKQTKSEILLQKDATTIRIKILKINELLA